MAQPTKHEARGRHAYMKTVTNVQRETLAKAAATTAA